MVNKEAFRTPVESCIGSADGLAGNHQMEEEAGSHPQHGSVGFELPPPYKGRPGKGCRMMVQVSLLNLFFLQLAIEPNTCCLHNNYS